MRYDDIDDNDDDGTGVTEIPPDDVEPGDVRCQCGRAFRLVDSDSLPIQCPHCAASWTTRNVTPGDSGGGGESLKRAEQIRKADPSQSLGTAYRSALKEGHGHERQREALEAQGVAPEVAAREVAWHALADRRARGIAMREGISYPRALVRAYSEIRGRR